MEKTKILLLGSSIEEQNREGFNPNTNYSLGLAYLDSILKKEGYEVISRDYAQFKEDFCLDEVRKILIEFKPQILGLSLMSMSRVSSYKIISLAKKIDANIKIILGGVHASIMYEQLLKNFPVDCIIIGEGEETIKELIPKLKFNKELDKIKGIAFLKKNKVIKNEDRPLITNLENIPFPSHEVFMNPNRTKICLLSSRGCPYMCSFCCLHIISKRKYRMRPYQNVVDEIEYILKKFPQIKEIEFSDDTFTLNEKRVIDFCKEILKRKIKIKFLCSARIKPMSKEMLSWMEKAGFKEVRFGIETGSKKLLDSIHKNITPEEIIDTFKIASKFPKIRFIKFLMVGFPGENDVTINETIELVKTLQKIIPMDFFCAAPLWVYPGTEIYEKVKNSGEIDDNFWLTHKPCPYYTLEHTQKELFNMANRIGWETSSARGYKFLIVFLLKKFLNNPSHQLKRIVKNKFLIPILFKWLKKKI